MILFNNGNIIRLVNSEDVYDNLDIPGWFALEFAGAFLAVLFWVHELKKSYEQLLTVCPHRFL